MTTLIDPQRRGMYLKGRAGVFAHTADPRFSYALFVPASGDARGLVVAVHHSLRNFIECRDGFADFAARHRLVVLAPLFPIGVLGDGNPDGYKYILEQGLRYDLLLHAMVDEVAQETGCDATRFCLFGYSGGGHFVHRHLLLHPQHVLAAAVGAPGQVTLLDADTDWWPGIRDVAQRFDRAVDRAALQRVPVLLLVGEEDTNTDEIGHAPGTRYWRAEAEHRGPNRIERLRKLQESLLAAGVRVRFELLPGVGHQQGSQPAMALAQRFFFEHLGLST